MIKYFFWVVFLLSCHSNVSKETERKGVASADTTIQSTAVNDRPALNKRATLFDNKAAFEILSVTNSFNTMSTDTATSKCSEWILTKADIEQVIKNAVPIGGTTWDLSFLVLSCTKSVALRQNGEQFKMELNAGSFYSVTSADTTLLFGDYKKSDRKFFLEPPDEN
jgi:hypothetical protein